MGVDLKLLPLLFPDFWASHEILGLERRRELWPAIEAVPQLDIPGTLSCYFAPAPNGDPHYGDVTEDPYGARLKWATAGTLLTLKEHEAVTDNWRNRAIWAYLAHMPETWPIVLWWC